jgi:hypothetical protein
MDRSVRNKGAVARILTEIVRDGRGEVFSKGAIRFLLGSASGIEPSIQALNSPMESSLPEPPSVISTEMHP